MNTQIKLAGVNSVDEICKTHQTSDVVAFADKDNYFYIKRLSNSAIKMTTGKGGIFLLKKHDTKNLFIGTCNGKQVHVKLNKVTGKVMFNN